MDTPNIPVSWGELIDKITILEIKSAKLTAVDARNNVTRELSLLRSQLLPLTGDAEIESLKTELHAVNSALWDIEDRIRAKEAARQFDAEFIELARSVYRTNDLRAGLKRRINMLLASGLVEEKSYTQY